MPNLAVKARFDRVFMLRLADWFAVGVAVALPWSTSATGILIVLWLASAVTALDASAIKRELLTAAGGLPVLLCGLGAIGMLWADVSWAARFAGFGSFLRLLTIPLLLAQFRLSVQGNRVIYGFVVSCAVLLLLSFLLELLPDLPSFSHVHGVPVHDDIIQSTEFQICGFGLFGAAFAQHDKGRVVATCALGLLGLLFIADFGLVMVSRISLVIMPILVALLGWRVGRWKGVVGTAILAALIGSVAFAASPSLRVRVALTIEEFQIYRSRNAGTSIGQHLAFLEEATAITASAPLIGHGTGSIPAEFRKIAAGQTGVSGEVTVNPHNQTFAVAIQIGLVGAVVLWAMWIAHLVLFRSYCLEAWLGTVVVTENIVSSVFHTHLFDFNNGWLYVLGVGVLGGMVLRHGDAMAVKPSDVA